MSNDPAHDVMRRLQELQGIEQRAIEKLKELDRARAQAETQLAALTKPATIPESAFKNVTQMQEDFDRLWKQHHDAIEQLQRILKST